MNKPLAGWAYSALSVAGVVLVGAFFLAWERFAGSSGWSLAGDEHRLYLVPLSGAALLAAASTRSSWTRLAALAAGALVAGDVGYQLLKGVVHGLESWCLFGGAALALAGGAEKHRALRGIGGMLVLAGFFAPWAHVSMFDVARANDDILFHLSFSVLWVVPVAGLVAMASASQHGLRGRRMSAFAGIAVFAATACFIASVANAILDWGAWATFGASALALIVGLIAPGEKPAANV